VDLEVYKIKMNSSVKTENTTTSFAPQSSPLFLQNGLTDSFKNSLLENECSNKDDFLALAIHEMIHEDGFQIQSSSPSLLSGKKLPDNWKNGEMYRFDYIYCDYNDIKCSVTVLLTGSSLLVTGTLNVDDSDDAYHVKLKTSEYINETGTNNETNSNVYKNLKKLSHKVKDNVSLMMINEIKTKLGLNESIGLLTLPQELKLQLIFYLDVSSICILSRVSKDLNMLCEDDEVWKQLLLCEFRGSNVQGVTYKEAFKHMYSARKREHEAFRGEEIPCIPFRPEFNIGPDLLYPPGFSGPYIPGMIGGYQDLHPSGLPRNPIGGSMNTPDLLLNRNHILRPPNARYDDPFSPNLDDFDIDPLNQGRVHPNLRHNRFAHGGRLSGSRGHRFGGGFGNSGGFDGFI